MGIGNYLLNIPKALWEGLSIALASICTGFYCAVAGKDFVEFIESDDDDFII